MKKGKFIVFEGINGCGKGTQIDLVSSYIRKKGKAVPIFLTGEPNEFDDNGKKAREILSSGKDPYEKSFEALKYFSENCRTHNKIFSPLLEQGFHVISDRYYHSRFAFQGAQGISYNEITKMNSFAKVPDLTFILDVPVKLAFDRLFNRDGKDRRKFDSDYEFVDKVRKNYLNLENCLPIYMKDNSIQIIFGEREPNRVFEQIKPHIDNLFEF